MISNTPAGDRNVLLTMRETLQHRGPDDAGVWWSSDGCIGLAHRRLSIIDLSAAARQPMGDASGALQITYNGEIYNYRELREELAAAHGCRFRTASDTEVILEAYRVWGTGCLQRLNGMFAFCIFDSRNRTLFLARDRAGKKPLYYRDSKAGFSFASELKALMADPSLSREVDPDALEHYLALGYVPGDMCMLRGVQKLPQGHAMLYRLDRGERHVWSYWDLPAPEHGQMTGEELTDELEELLSDAVRRRMIADVPVGIMLSGGLDSSIVTALVARSASSPVKTFTVSFPGAGMYDEASFARTVAEHFGTDHTELVAEPTSLELLAQLAVHFDEPLATGSMVPTYLVSRMIRDHAAVALGGDGGDELFGGYAHYSRLQQLEKYRRFVPRAVRAGLGHAASRFAPASTRGRQYLLGFESTASTIAHFNIIFDARMRERLLNRGVRERSRSGSSPEAYRARLGSGATPLQRATSTDFRSYLVDDVLVKVDRASMLASLEVRAPWLDHRVVELAFRRTPDLLRASTSERKILPRRLARRLLPPELDLHRKQGFSIPLSQWVRGSWGSFFADVLRDASPEIFDVRMIGDMLAATRRGAPHARRLFALTIFELWRRHYGVSPPY